MKLRRMGHPGCGVRNRYRERGCGSFVWQGSAETAGPSPSRCSGLGWQVFLLGVSFGV